jgi:hypothetical protein
VIIRARLFGVGKRLHVLTGKRLKQAINHCGIASLGKRRLWLSDIIARDPSLHDTSGSEVFAFLLEEASIIIIRFKLSNYFNT